MVGQPVTGAEIEDVVKGLLHQVGVLRSCPDRRSPGTDTGKNLSMISLAGVLKLWRNESRSRFIRSTLRIKPLLVSPRF